MPAKIHSYGIHTNKEGVKQFEQFWFHCPGCLHMHAFTVGGPPGSDWSWNGSYDLPTFSPSLLCNKDFPGSRCHSFVTDGRIQFLPDCWHALAGQTVDLPDWED